MKLLTQLNRYTESERLLEIGAAWTLTNTEFNALGCSRLYSLDYVEQLIPRERKGALTFGIAWHRVLETILKDSINDDSLPDEDMVYEACLSLMETSLYNERDTFDPFTDASSVMADMCDRAERGIRGWYRNWVTSIQPRFKVVSVELSVAAPIRDQSGCIFAPEMLVLEEEDILRPLRIGEMLSCEKKDLHRVRFPYWRMGKIDVVLEERDTGALFILDHKTTGSPNSYSRKLRFDMQLIGYAALLRWEIENNPKYNQWKGKEIRGVIWDLCNSNPPKEPQPLKSGKLSTAMSRAAPSWLYEKAIKTHGLELSDYADFIEELKYRVDGNHFVIEEMSLSNQDLDRADRESFAAANKITELKKALWSVDRSERYALDYVAPRYPLCQRWGNCKFSEGCLSNASVDDHLSDRGNKLFWKILK